MPFVFFKRKSRAIIELMHATIKLILQRVCNERLIKELEGLMRGIKNLEPTAALEIKKIDKNILAKLDETKKLIEEGAAEEKILALTTEIGLQLLQREQKCNKISRQ